MRAVVGCSRYTCDAFSQARTMYTTEGRSCDKADTHRGTKFTLKGGYKFYFEGRLQMWCAGPENGPNTDGPNTDRIRTEYGPNTDRIRTENGQRTDRPVTSRSATRTETKTEYGPNMDRKRTENGPHHTWNLPVFRPGRGQDDIPPVRCAGHFPCGTRAEPARPRNGPKRMGERSQRTISHHILSALGS